MAKNPILEVQSKIREYIAEVKKHYDNEKVYLFGSYANGNITEYSDIDLAFVSVSFSGNRFVDNVNLGKLTWGIDTRIEPIAFTPEDFDRLLIAQEVKKTGIELPLN